MAHLWIERKATDGYQWAIAPLSHKVAGYVITGDNNEPVRTTESIRTSSCLPRIIGILGKGDQTWVLIASADMRVRVNGLPLFTGRNGPRTRLAVRSYWPAACRSSLRLARRTGEFARGTDF